jgi:hypothetical protein
MKMQLNALLRVLALASSLSMLGGYVWFSQRKAQSSVPATVPATATAEAPLAPNPIGVETTVIDADGKPVTIILGTKSINQPIFSTRQIENAAKSLTAPAPAEVTKPSVYLLSGSKSFTGAATIVADQLQLGKTSQSPQLAVEAGRLLTPEELEKAKSRAMMPGSKRSSGVITPDSIDDLLLSSGVVPEPAKTPIPNQESQASPKSIMPGSKSGPIELIPPVTKTPPAQSPEEKPLLLPPAAPATNRSGTQHNQTIHPKPVSLRGKLGPIQATPDSAGNLVLATKPSEPKLQGNFGEERLIAESGFRMPAEAALGPHGVMASTSKSGMVLRPPRIDAAWFTWDLAEAMRDIADQIMHGFVPSGPTSDRARPAMISSSKWRPVLPAPREKTSSVLSLPDQNPPSPQP